MKIIGYNQKYFKPFSEARIIKDIIPEYVWCMDNEEGEELILPTHGKTIEKLKYIFAKEKFLTFLAHAELNELGQQKFEKDLSLFDVDEFHPYDGAIRPTFYDEKTDFEQNAQVSSYAWYLDWTLGFKEYKVVVDLFIRPYLYMDDNEQFSKKRIYIFKALKKSYKNEEVKKIMQSANFDLVPEIKDPVEWQKEERKDREMPLMSMDLDMSFDLVGAIPMQQEEKTEETQIDNLTEETQIDNLIASSFEEIKPEEIIELNEFGENVVDEPDEFKEEKKEETVFGFTFKI